MTRPSRIVIIGATGLVGRRSSGTLRNGGHEVVAVARALGIDLISAKGSTRR